MEKRKSTDAQLRATAKYQAKNTKIYPIRLNFNTDQDVIDRLSEVPSVAGYIKQLIREDIQRGNG